MNNLNQIVQFRRQIHFKKKYNVVNELFKRFFIEQNLKKTINELNIENFIKIKSNNFPIFLILIVNDLIF